MAVLLIQAGTEVVGMGRFVLDLEIDKEYLGDYYDKDVAFNNLTYLMMLIITCSEVY